MKNLILIAVGLVFLTKMPVLAQQEFEILMMKRNYSDALKLIETEISASPSAELYYKKGLVLNSLQNYGGAIDAYQSAVQADSANCDAITELAECYSMLGNYHDAAYWFNKVVQLQPENLVLLAKQGRNYISLKDYKQAYDCFTNIYKSDSTNIYWNKQLAYCAFRNGNKKQSQHLYQQVLSQNPRDYSTYTNLIRTYDKQKEDTLITAIFEKGLTNFPGDAELLGERARFYFETKKYDLAKPDFESYFQAGGDSVYTVLMNYGIACYFAGND